MRYLLDTHAFLWWVADDTRLSEAVRKVIKDSENEIMVSSASVWEMSIKTGVGRLRIPGDMTQFMSEQLATQGFSTLPINLHHALHVAKLPLLHRDPFDRMLIAQTIVENLVLITADSAMTQYEIPLLW